MENSISLPENLKVILLMKRERGRGRPRVSRAFNSMKLHKVPIFGTFIVGAISDSNPMKRNTSITVGSHFETFIHDQIENGRYSSTSEVVRAGLRLLEQEEEKLKVLRQALIEGEKSGFIDNFDPQAFKEKLKQRHLV